MRGLEEILRKKDPLPIRELSRWFRKKHMYLVLNHEYAQNFFSDIYSFFSRPQFDYTDEEWDQIRLISYIFPIVYHYWPSNLNFQIPTESTHGPTITASFILSFVIHRNADILQYFHRSLLNNHLIFFPTTKVQSFYSICPCYYFQILFTILEEHMFYQPFFLDIATFMHHAADIKPECLTMSIISSVSELCKRMINCIVRKNNRTLPDKFIEGFAHIVNLCQVSPSILLNAFFYIWLYLIQNGKNIPNIKFLNDQLPMITSCFEKSSLMKYHELHRSFPWYLTFYFFGFLETQEPIHRIRVLSMICNAVRTTYLIDAFTLKRFRDNLVSFTKKILSQYNERNPYYLYQLLTNLNSTLEVLVYKLPKIHAVGKISPAEIVRIKTRQISFLEQSNYSSDSSIFDTYLFSRTNEKFYSNEDACLKDFEKQCKICDNIRKRFQSVTDFHQMLLQNFRHALIEEASKNSDFVDSAPAYYFIKTILTITNLLIVASHKQMEIQSYRNKDVFTNIQKLSETFSHYQNPQKLLDFTDLYKIYYQLLDNMPHSIVDSVAHYIAREIYSSLRKNLITIYFSQNFYSANQKNANNPQSLFMLVLKKLIEIASHNIDLVFSKEIESVNLFYSLICFSIRMAGLSSHPNLQFGCTLKLFQKLFFFSIFCNMKSISHQTVATRLVSHYLKALNENYIVKSDRTDYMQKSRIKPANVEEFEPSARLDALSTVLELSGSDHEYMSTYHLIPILDAALSSKDQSLIDKAAKICLRIFKEESPTFWDKNYSDRVRRIFKQFFDAIKTTDSSTASEMMELLPKYAPFFLHSPQMQGVERLVCFLTKETNIDLLLVITSASSHLTYSEDELLHLFTLVSTCFEVVLDHVIEYEASISAVLLHLISTLKIFFGFGSLKSSLNNLISYITKSFGELFLRNESNLYIICVLDAMGLNRSQTTNSLMELAISFFEYCKGKPYNPAFILKTVEDLFSSFPLSTRLFSILNGFSLFIRYYPQYITLSHIRSFLIQTTEIHFNDNAFTITLNHFLKEFLKQNDHNTNKKFVALVYENICPLSMTVRSVLEKRVSKLRIPIAIHSLSEISKITEELLLFQKLTLAFFCGIEGNLIAELNNDWIKKILEFATWSQSDGIHRFEKYSRVLSLLLSIFKSEDLFRFFINNGPQNFFFKIVHFLLNNLTISFPPIYSLAKKCFNILNTKYPNELKTISQIDDFLKNPEKLFHFWDGSPDKIAFYAKLTKMNPEKTPPEIIIRFFDEIPVYIEKTDQEKMRLMLYFVKILRQFTVKKYINQESVRSIVLRKNPNSSNNLTYLETYIESILTLMKHPTIPFRALLKKSIMKFLSMFPQQTVHYLVNSNNDNANQSFILLEDLIMEDQSQELLFFTNFLSIFEPQHNITIFSPALYSIFEKVSLDRRYAKDQLLMVLRNLLSSFEKILTDPAKINENALQILTIVASSMIQIFKVQQNLKFVINLTFKIFQTPIFFNSSIYKKYQITIFNKLSKNHISEILLFTFKHLEKFKPLSLDILIMQCLKTVSTFSDNISSILIENLLKLLYQPQNFVTFLKSIRVALSKVNPTKEQLIVILDCLKKGVTSSDVQTTVYSLKLCIKLAELKYLPPVIFDSIVQQFFSFPKFFDFPYSPYSFELLLSNPDMVEKLSPNVIETITFFFYDKFLNLKEVVKLTPIILKLGNFFEILPFSFPIAISTLIDKSITNSKADQELLSIKDLLLFLIHYYQKYELSEEENKIFFYVGFKYVSKVMNEESVLHLIKDIDNFFSICIQANSNFSEEILSQMVNVQNNCMFGIVCCASHFIPEILFKKYAKLVESALKYSTNDKSIVKIDLFSSLIEDIFSKREFYINFSNSLLSMFEIFKNNFSEKNYERFLVIVELIIRFHYDDLYHQILSQLWNLYFEKLKHVPNLKETNSYNIVMPSLFNMMVRILDFLPTEDQTGYLQMMVDNLNWTLHEREMYTTSLISLIISPNIMISVKKQMLEALPMLAYGNNNNLSKLCESIKIFGKNNNVQVIGYVIYIEILISSISSPSQALSSFERIEKLIGSDLKERLKFFIHMLPLEIWSDDYLIYIVALVTEKIKLWQPMFAFSHKLKRCAVTLGVQSFKRLMDPDLAGEFQSFLKILFKENGKISYNQAISTIVQVFYQSDYPLPYILAFKASCITGEFEFDHKFFSEGDIVQQRFILPSYLNHIYFGLSLPEMTKEQACASSLTLLQQYQIAEIFYRNQEIESLNSTDTCLVNPRSFYNQVRMVNSHFVEPHNINDLTFDELLKPIKKIDRRIEDFLILFNETKDAFLNNNKDHISELLQQIKKCTFESYRSHRHASIYQSERIIVIETLANSVEKILTGEIESNNDLNRKFSFLNPTFINLIINFNEFLSKGKFQQKVTIDDREVPYILIQPNSSIYHRNDCSDFNTISGITSRGLYALSVKQINDYFNLISQKITNKSMNSSSWRSFASFCFNIFLTQQTCEMFSAAIGAYSQIFATKDDVNMITRQESAARLITLFRIGIRKIPNNINSNNDLNNSFNTFDYQGFNTDNSYSFSSQNNSDFKKIISDTAYLFKERYYEIWKFWLLQLIELSQEKWFLNLTIELFGEMTYRSLLYAGKFASHDLRDYLYKTMAEKKNFVQVKMMNEMEQSINQIYQRNLDQIEYQSHILDFIQESTRLSDEEIPQINLMQVRQRKYKTSKFEDSLCYLMKNDIDKVMSFGSFQDFVNHMRSITPEQKELFVMDFTNSSDTLSNQKMQLANDIEKFNDQMPFIFPIRIESFPQLSIFKFHNNVSKLTSDLILVRATTSIESTSTFLLLKSHNDKGLHASVMTLNTAFFLFKQLLQNSYPSRMRSITLATSYCFEMGEDKLLMPLQSEPISLKNLFESETLISQEDWVKKYTDQNGDITAEGLENVKTFSHDSLIRYHSTTMPIKTFVRLRYGLSKSYAASAIVRHMFSAPYPDMTRLIACTKAAEIPVLPLDFDNGLAFLNDVTWSTFRMSLTIEKALGKSALGELFLNMAAVANAFSTHLESIRAYLELILCDEMSHENYSVEEIIERRAIIENRLLSNSPPETEQATEEECLEWYDNLTNIIEKSRNPLLQPARTIPWF